MLKKIIFIILIFVAVLAGIALMPEETFAQSNSDYRSNTASGNWGTAGSWEAFNGSIWVTATTSPTNLNAQTITIRNGHNITVATGVTADQVVIESGGQGTINTGVTLTIAAGAGVDLDINSGGLLVLNSTTGALTISASAVVDVYGTLRKANTSTSGSGGITITGSLNFKSGGVYEHNTDVGAIPIATAWESGSTMKYTGNQATVTLPTNINQTYHHMAWEATAATAIKTFASASWTINGNFTQTGGSIIWRNGNSSSVTVSIGGDLSVSGGTFQILGATGNANTDGTITVTGNVSYTGGTFTFCRTGNAGSISLLDVAGDVTVNASSQTMNMSMAACLGQMEVGGDFTHSAGTITETSTGSGTITFNKSGIQTFSNGGTISNTIDFNVSSGSTLQMAAESTVVSGGGTFTLFNGAGLGITSANGIVATGGGASGNIQTTTRTFNTGSTYIYNRASGGAQNVGTGFPTNLTGTLRIENSGGTVTLDNARTIAGGGTVDLKAGTLAAGTNITMNTTSFITRSAGSMTGTPQGSGSYNVTYTGDDKNTGSELSGSGRGNIVVNLTAGQTLTLDTARSMINGSQLTLTSGIFAAGTNLTMNSTSNISISAGTMTGTLQGSGAYNVTFTGSSKTAGSAEFSGSGLNNVTLNMSSGAQTVTLGSDIVLDGILTVTLGTLDTDNTNNYDITASSIDLANTFQAIFNARGSVITLFGTSGFLLGLSFGDSSIFNAHTSEIKITSSSGNPSLTDSFTDLTLHKLTIDSTATVINSGTILTINNASGAALTINQGVFNIDDIFTGPGSGNGTLTIASGATLCLGGTYVSTNATCDSGVTHASADSMPTFQTYSFNTNSTVRYLSNAAQTVSASPTYGNLVLAPKLTAGRTYTLGAMTINGNFEINPQAGSALELLVDAPSAVTVANGKTTTIKRTTSATSRLASTNTFQSGHIDIQAGGTLTSNSAVGFSGDWANNGTFTCTSCSVEANGTGAQAINDANTFYDLEIAASSARTITFEAGVTQTIASGGSAIFQGASGQLLTLQSSAAESNWNFAIPAGSSRTVSYTAAIDANATDSAIVASNSTCLRTTNWTCEAGGPETPSRGLRLFEGFNIKFFGGRMILYQN